MLNIRGHETADYFQIVCEKCGTPTKNKYLGRDPSVPHFESECERCKTKGRWKLAQPGDWKGLPPDPLN